MITPQEIKRGREGTGMTQIEVAIAVGVSVPAYRLWEAGGTKPTPENEEKLRQVLQLGRIDDNDTGQNKASHTA